MADYTMQPKKPSILILFPNWPAYLLFAFIYMFSLFGIIGLWLIDFIQMFILSQYLFTHTTSIYQFIGQNFFFIVRTSPVTDSEYMFEIIMPLLIVVATFLLCFIIKQLLKETKSPYMLQVRHFFVYNLLLTVWSIFIMPIFFKVCQHIQFVISNKILLPPN